MKKGKPSNLLDCRHSMVWLAVLLASTTPAGAAEPKSANGCAAEKYRVVELPLQPNQINDAGAVAGTTSERRAAFWSNQGGLKELPPLPGLPLAEGRAINEQGRVLATATEADGGHAQSFTFENGKVSPVAGEHSRASAMNNHGDLAGESKLPGASASGPARWRNGVPMTLGACCGGRAIALNNHGQVVGEAYDKEGRYRAFLWEEKIGLRLIGPDGIYSSGIAVNDAGHALVYGFADGAWIYRDGGLQAIKLSERWPSQPHAISGCDVVVGGFGANSEESHAFIWDAQHGFRDLNDLIPKKAGWTLEVATSINNRGEIVGKGEHEGEDDNGFLLVPVNP